MENVATYEKTRQTLSTFELNNLIDSTPINDLTQKQKERLFGHWEYPDAEHLTIREATCIIFNDLAKLFEKFFNNTNPASLFDDIGSKITMNKKFRLFKYMAFDFGVVGKAFVYSIPVTYQNGASSNHVMYNDNHDEIWRFRMVEAEKPLPVTFEYNLIRWVAFILYIDIVDPDK